jgi:hypothetical protein
MRVLRHTKILFCTVLAALWPLAANAADKGFYLGAGLGANHQTGWTGLVANLIDEWRR